MCIGVRNSNNISNDFLDNSLSFYILEIILNISFRKLLLIQVEVKLKPCLFKTLFWWLSHLKCILPVSAKKPMSRF